MPIDYQGVEAESTRYVRPACAKELFSKQVMFDHSALPALTGYPFGVHETENLRNDHIDAAAYEIDYMFQLEMDMAQFRNDPSALDILTRRLSESAQEREAKYFMDSSAMWVEAYKEIIKHPVRNWIRATWWMIRQLLRKKQPAETA